MFIENLTQETLTFRAHGQAIVLKPGINTIEDATVKVNEIIQHFGTYINIYTTNATLLAKAQEVKDEKLITENNNSDTANTGDTDGEFGQKQEDNEPSGTDNGEEQDLADDTGSGKDTEGDGEDKTKISEDEPSQEDSQEKDGEGQGTKEEESEEDEKPALEDFKREQLIALAKKLNLEFKGNISNVNLIKLIKEAQK